MSSNGGFVPGETVPVIAYFKNVGHYMATNAQATITSTSEYVTIEEPTLEMGTIDPTGVIACLFNVTVDANCPMSEALPLTFTLNADGGLMAEGSGVLKNACNVVFDLKDSYGDGWNGASLRVSFSDGTPQQTLTIASGNSSASYTFEIGNGVTVSLSWTSGSWDGECSFIIHYEDGGEIYNCTSVSGAFPYEFVCNCGSGTPIGAFNPVENLQAEAATAVGVTLTWDAPEGAINYIVSRNGIEIGETAETTYFDPVAHDGFYTYGVVAEYPEGVSVPAIVTIEFLDAVEEAECEFHIYPNPVNNTLYINGGNAEYSYVMYNGMGQIVASGIARGTEQISVNGMTSGVYILRLTTGTQVRVEKVVVK